VDRRLQDRIKAHLGLHISIFQLI